MSVDWETEVGQPTTALFGSAAIYFPANDAPSFAVVGVFDEAYKEIVIQDGLSYTSELGPVIGITDGQLAIHGWVAQQNDKVQIADPLIRAMGTIFIVKEARPDGHGITRLVLQEWEPS